MLDDFLVSWCLLYLASTKSERKVFRIRKIIVFHTKRVNQCKLPKVIYNSKSISNLLLSFLVLFLAILSRQTSPQKEEAIIYIRI